MRVILGFMKGIGTLQRPWQAWVLVLASSNMIVPWFFIDRLEARVVLAAIFLAAAIQMALFAKKGFVRLLGVSHAPWLALLPWLATRLPPAPTESAFGTWLLLLLAVNGLSLVIDAVDVARYLRGETEASYVMSG